MKRPSPRLEAARSGPLFQFPLNVRSVNADLKYDVYVRRGTKEREVRKLSAVHLLDHDAARNKARSVNDPRRERARRTRVRVRPR